MAISCLTKSPPLTPGPISGYHLFPPRIASSEPPQWFPWGWLSFNYEVVSILSNLEWLVQVMCGTPGPPQIAISSMKTLTLFFLPLASDGTSNAVRRHCDLRPFIQILHPTWGNEPRSYENCSQPGLYGDRFPHSRGSVTLRHWVITGCSWISIQGILPTINPGSISIKMRRLWFPRGL